MARGPRRRLNAATLSALDDYAETMIAPRIAAAVVHPAQRFEVGIVKALHPD